MLVYANNFILAPQGGPKEIIRFIARWVGQRPPRTEQRPPRTEVDSRRLAEGVRELRLKDGGKLSSRTTRVNPSDGVFPYLFSAQLRHPDEKVGGRRWITEIGIRQEADTSPIQVSIVLKTDEISARVTAPIQVTRPRIVEQLVTSCSPVGQTPGLVIKELTEASAEAFLREVERVDRGHPLVVLSPSRDGSFPVEPERLRSFLVGLSDVVRIPVGADTFAIQDVTGRAYVAFGGALNIIFPPRSWNRENGCERLLFRTEYLAEVIAEGRTIESEVLAAITHRTNLIKSWHHISPERVAEAVLRAQFEAAISQARSGDVSSDLSVYVGLLESADEEFKKKDAEIEDLREQNERAEARAQSAEARAESLHHALSGRRLGENDDRELSETLAPLREVLSGVLNGRPTLQEVVEFIGMLFSDRVVFLDSAVDSAKESDRGGFSGGEKALQLLHSLVTDYWQALSSGQGDQHAKNVFGSNVYAPREASTLTNEGKRRRTFTYRGRDFFMERHLKQGYKDSLAETLRVHFEWIANEKKIIVGHCGKHLDF